MTPGQRAHWFSSGMPICGIVRRSGRKTSSTVQSKLPVPRSPATSQLPGTISASARAKDAAPVERAAVRAAARLAIVADHLEAAQHPGGLLTAAAELPAPADAVTALDRHRLSAARHRGAGDDRVGPLRVDFARRPRPAGRA